MTRTIYTLFAMLISAAGMPARARDAPNPDGPCPGQKPPEMSPEFFGSGTVDGLRTTKE